MRRSRETNIPLARRLRAEGTEAEARMWSRLRNRALGVKFRRQVPVAGYILDFYCPEAQLVLELDGAQHLEPAMVEADAKRTCVLESLGLTVIRFYDNEVLCALDDVVRQIADEVQDRLGNEAIRDSGARAPHPDPLPASGERG